MKLSQSQKEVVFSPWKNTITLVLSTAGSGKTLALTCRAVRIASELAQQPNTNSRVLCICFNVSAAEEMAARITNLVYAHGLADKIIVTRQQFQPRDLVAIEIRTFHALGYWIIRSANGSERQIVGLRQGSIKLLSGTPHLNMIIETLEEARLLQPSMKKTARNKVARQYQEYFNEYKNMSLEREIEGWLSQLDARPHQDSKDDGESRPQVNNSDPSRGAFEFYKQRMQEQNCVTYDDMLMKSVILLQKVGRIREKMASRYQAVLVDEFQDLTPLEFFICKSSVEKSMALTMVGDDDQQIYSFRSSRTWYCPEIVACWFPENLKILQLPENRRCPGAVVKSAAAVIARNSRRVPKDIKAVLPSGNPVRIIGCQNSRLEIMFVINRIKRLLPTVRKRKEHILVLFRTNLLLNVFQKQLRLADVATSRVLIEAGDTDTIGSKTLATFALICLMSRRLDRATFLWAVVTASDLRREFVESILDSARSDEQGVKSELSIAGSSNCNQDGKRLREDNGVAAKPGVSEKPYPSPYLEILSTWYALNRSHETGTTENTELISLFQLLEKTDWLLLKLRKLSDATKVVQIAEQIISTTSTGQYEDYIQYSQDETTDTTSDTIGNGKGGFDLLTSAAREIDENAREECGDAGEDTNDGAEAKSDEKSQKKGKVVEDFFGLFGEDRKSTNKRKRDAGRSSKVDTRKAMERQRELGTKVDKLCETLGATLTRSDRSGSGKISRTERPSTMLSTIHKAKGTSFAFVFLCGANLRDLPVTAGYELDCTGSIDTDSEKNQEERRLFFVSLTRTMREFTCTYSSQGDSTSPISYWRSIFVTELLDSLGDCKNSATELFVTEEKDISSTVDTLQFATEIKQPNAKCEDAVKCEMQIWE